MAFEKPYNKWTPSTHRQVYDGLRVATKRIRWSTDFRPLGKYSQKPAHEIIYNFAGYLPIYCSEDVILHHVGGVYFAVSTIGDAEY